MKLFNFIALIVIAIAINPELFQNERSLMVFVICGCATGLIYDLKKLFKKD